MKEVRLSRKVKILSASVKSFIGQFVTGVAVSLTSYKMVTNAESADSS
jgi:hypothetical protein